jgi:hypothetical protein
VEAQGPVRERARVGGEERGAVLAGAGHLAVGGAEVGSRGRRFVADRAHQLAAIVLEDGRAEVGAEPHPEAAQLRLGVARGRQPPQQHHAAAVLELVADVGDEALRARQREVVAADRVPGEATPAHGAQRRVDLGDRIGC